MYFLRSLDDLNHLHIVLIVICYIVIVYFVVYLNKNFLFVQNKFIFILHLYRVDCSVWRTQIVSPLLLSSVCKVCIWIFSSKIFEGCRGPDRMVAGFTTTYVISVYHH